MLNVGDIAPDFELLSDENKPVRMSDYRGKRVILFFYPKADTSGCTTQACGLRDNLPQFEDANATVIGISPDQVSALTKWQAKEHFGYRLLSDPDHVVAESYGVWGEKKMYGRAYMGIIRSHFVIGEDGRIEDAQYKVSPKTSVERAVKFIG
ncbi:MAG: thioredoxin-dependent thiol peroxidase [Anaerolineae bacterium]|nr:thioredoxin-dependent thiol peroxidase [Anaerolineae bacterium]